MGRLYKDDSIAILLAVPSYAAFIGHQPHLSLAELSATAPGFRFTDILEKSVVLFETDAPLPAEWLKTLGGTIVIAEKISDGSVKLQDVPQMLVDQVKHLKGKVTFGLRTVHISPRDVNNLYRSSKELLKKMGKPSRYVGNERKAALSIVLHSQGLLNGKDGAELTIVKRKDDLWVGITRDAQDVDAYTKRDMEKPVRDTTVGLLPPKLAQIMLNLGIWLAGGSAPRALPPDPKAKSKKVLTRPFTVFDPFCGTGVIPMEALLRGYAVLASDKSEKAVAGCLKNLEWIRKQEHILKTDVPSKVWKQDAQKPFELDTIVDVIVTETSLGPNLRARPTLKEISAHRSENEELQYKFLENVAKSLPGVPLVCTWPVWYASKGATRLEKIWKQLPKLGFEPVLPRYIVSALDTPSLLYRRPEQFVGREIVLLRPL